MNDVLIQHIKFRLGDDPANNVDPDDGDNLVVRHSQRVVIDHCSFSWGMDETVSTARGSNNDITFSNCIFAEALCKSHHYKEGAFYPEKHSYNVLTYHGNQTFKDNLFAYSYGRNPVLRPGRKDVINNFIYATGWAGPMLEWYTDPNLPETPMLASIVGNVIVPIEDDEFHIGATAPAVYVVNNHSDDSRLYVEDNRCQEGEEDPELSQWELVYRNSLVTQANSSPNDLSGYTIRPSSEVESYVLANAGAFYWDRDPTDERIVFQVSSRTGNLVDSVYALPARASALTAPGFVSGDRGNMDLGFDWASNPSTFTVNSTTVSLTVDCNNIDEVMEHVNSQLPNGVRCVQLNGAIDLPHVGFETVEVGASAQLTVSGSGLADLGITAGTYYGADALPGAYPTQTASHTLTLPADPHVIVEGLSNLERWVLENYGQ